MLEGRGLTKRYSGIAAVDHIDLCIRRGEILGCLGPNGAGKSTTIKMLIGLLEPTAGSISLDGRPVRDNLKAFQQRLGYVPEESNLYPHLSGREYLQLVGRLRGLRRSVLEDRIDGLLQAFHLWEDRDSLLTAYSKGMRQKVLISSALLHNPELLVLDEPFSGLDTMSAMVVRSLIRRLANQGKMILYSSHVLETVEKVCDSVLILRKGRVVAQDSLPNLRGRMSEPSLEGVFTQLSQMEDTDAVADQILSVVAR